MTQATTANAAPLKSVPPTMPSDTLDNSLHDLVLKQLDDDQAQEVVSIPLEG